jgi:hypothetical protein
MIVLKVVRYEVLTAASIKMESVCLWNRVVPTPAKCLSTSTRLHSTTSQKALSFVLKLYLCILNWSSVLEHSYEYLCVVSLFLSLFTLTIKVIYFLS